jgi:hypothetical protein
VVQPMCNRKIKAYCAYSTKSLFECIYDVPVLSDHVVRGVVFLTSWSRQQEAEVFYWFSPKLILTIIDASFQVSLLFKIHSALMFSGLHELLVPLRCTLHHSLFSKTLRARHRFLENFPKNFHHGCANNPALTSISIFYSSKIKAQCRPAFCWINSDFFSNRSYVQFNAYNKLPKHCRKGHLKNSIRMVWISDLDNPKVQFRLKPPDLLNKVVVEQANNKL